MGFEDLDVQLSVITHLVQRWETRLVSVKERQMRQRLLLEVLEEVSVSELVACLSMIVDRARAGLGHSRELLQELALDPGVVQYLPYDRLMEAYSRARETGFDEIAKMFLSDKRPWEDPAAKTRDDNDHLDLPLGIRRSAARTKDRDMLDRLVHDRNPRVIELLLDNPRVVERDVIRIVARRPTSPDILKTVARHRKWASRYAIRKTLVCNPYTPTDIITRLLPTILVQDLPDALRGGPAELAARVQSNSGPSPAEE